MTITGNRNRRYLTIVLLAMSVSLFSISALADKRIKSNPTRMLDKVASKSMPHSGWKDIRSIRGRVIKRGKWTDWKDNRGNKSWQLPGRSVIKGSSIQRGIVEPMF